MTKNNAAKNTANAANTAKKASFGLLLSQLLGIDAKYHTKGLKDLAEKTFNENDFIPLSNIIDNNGEKVTLNAAFINRVISSIVKDAAKGIIKAQQILSNGKPIKFTIKYTAERGKGAGNEVVKDFDDYIIIIDDNSLGMFKEYAKELKEVSAKAEKAPREVVGIDLDSLTSGEFMDIFNSQQEKAKEKFQKRLDRGQKLAESRKKSKITEPEL